MVLKCAKITVELSITLNFVLQQLVAAQCLPGTLTVYGTDLVSMCGTCM
jgi:hypothetical protein